MKKILSLLFPLATLISGCNLEEIQDQQMNLQDERIFTASFEQNETRTYVENGNLLRWNAGDKISIFEGNTLNRQYQFDGETGDNAGTFSIVNKPFGTGNDLTCHYAIYPYASTVKITENGVITATLPAEQNYAENSFGLGANTMVAVTKNTDDTFLKFKNVGGYLKLQLYGENVTVQSITLNGNNNEKLAGKSTITPSYGLDPTVVMGEDATASIILNCGDGVKIGSTEEIATDFWIVVPPTAFTSGFSITITDINGETFTKNTSNEIVIERNVIKPMKAFEVTIENDAEEEEESTIPNNQIWYTSARMVEPDSYHPWEFATFGANIISHEYNELTDAGIITFDTDVTTIGDWAFSYKGSMSNITIPNSVTTIGESAFISCGLTSFIVPNGVTTIQDYAFSGTNNLVTITIGNNVTTIGKNAFSTCGLINITIPDNVTTVGENAFHSCRSLTSAIIGDGLTSIEANTFRDCNNLTNIVIGNSVQTIGSSAFWSCQALKEVIIPDSVTTIESKAFLGCISMENVTIGNNVSIIKDGAFYSCWGLTSVTIPESVTEIEYGAFQDCTSLIEFNGKYVSDDRRSLIIDGTICAFAPAGLTSYKIPNGVKTIEAYTFNSCENLEKVTIPNSVSAIGSGAFGNCTNLSDIVIQGSVASLEYATFLNCTSLTSIVLPSSVSYINSSAFENCNNLKEVYCYNSNPAGINGKTFQTCHEDLVIYVPAESLEAYKAADFWKDLNIIGMSGSTDQFPWFNPDQYITYVENYEVIEPNADDWYEYSSAIGCPISPFSKIELKYKMIDDGSTCYLCCRNRARENTSAIYLDKYGLVITDEDEDEIREYTYSWAALNVNKSDCMILSISFKDKEIKINDTTIEYKMDKLSSFRSGLLFSYFRSENDEGTWRVSGEGVPEGSKLYYVKIWDNNDNLVYLGAASKALNSKTSQEEYCWQSYYNETNHYEFAYYPTTHSNYSPYGGGVDK